MKRKSIWLLLAILALLAVIVLVGPGLVMAAPTAAVEVVTPADGSISLESLGTVLGATAAVALFLLMLTAVFKEKWTDNTNRIAAMLASIVFVEVAVFATGSGDWKTYLAGLFLGFQVTLSVLNGSGSIVKGITVTAQRMTEPQGH